MIVASFAMTSRAQSTAATVVDVTAEAMAGAEWQFVSPTDFTVVVAIALDGAFAVAGNQGDQSRHRVSQSYGRFIVQHIRYDASGVVSRTITVAHIPGSAVTIDRALRTASMVGSGVPVIITTSTFLPDGSVSESTEYTTADVEVNWVGEGATIHDPAFTDRFGEPGLELVFTSAGPYRLATAIGGMTGIALPAADRATISHLTSVSLMVSHP